MEHERCVPATPEAIARAAQIIADGGVIAFPTDTVYGLACDLFNPAAVRRIYTIKGRSH
ncbi:MAG TPA: Sua5/YciO/YrdC/YwlC family protein, partial [Armatimonadota bacterium]|nr:Sua5/YciO/YrdC/YwlC family protein [Armatimonadota bacterium]